MSIPPDSRARGCSSNFPVPVRERDVADARRLVGIVDHVNRFLPEIAYRVDYRECDVRHPVYRWDTRTFQEIIATGTGFQAWPQGNTPDNLYYNLNEYVQHAGAPLNPHRRTPHAFIATTLSTEWQPNPNLRAGQRARYYRYEIFAPGGIWVAVSLRRLYGRHRSQGEITFVAGIAPQYIRSVQTFTATYGVERMTAENRLIMNDNFRPHIEVHFLVYTEVDTYVDENGVERYLPEESYTPDPNIRRQKREVSPELEWYRHGVLNAPIYINAAFRSSRKNEAYIFMNNYYALLNYAPGTTDDRIVNGPLLICDGFPSLSDTPFGEYGIDCAFDTDGNKAYIFSMNLCTYIDYAPGTTDDKILDGPMLIADMFPCLKGKVFDKGIDAAIRSSSSNEAYLFSGGQYVLINYDSKTLIHTETIRNGFPSLVGTIFETGIEAAFASHRNTKEAYIFKGEYYAVINFAPGTTDDYILGGKVKLILPNWPSLRAILPRKNGRLDVHTHKGGHPEQHHEHDEL